MVSVPGQAQGIVEDEFAVSRRSFGSYCSGGCDGGRHCLWTDRPIRKTRQTSQPAAIRAGAPAGSRGASPARAGDSRGADLGLLGRSLRNAPSLPISPPTATLTLQSSGAGTTMNSLAAPDVRAPSVRGRWHFQGLFKRSGGPEPPDPAACHAVAGQMPDRYGTRFHRPATSFPTLALACLPAADIRWRS